jgi:hypothetical protein
VIGTGVKVGPHGTVTPATSTSTSTSGVSPEDMAVVRALPMRPTVINGTLVFVSLGVTLQAPPSAYEVQRALAWTYNSTAGVFSAVVVITGNVSVAKAQKTATGSSVTSDFLACAMNGTLTLVSAAYPGPGFNGTYTVTQGMVTLSPDPWSHWGLQGSSTSARHLLGSGTRQPFQHDYCTAVQLLHTPGMTCSVVGGHSGNQQPSTGEQDYILPSAGSHWDTDHQTTASSRGSGRRLLQAGGNTTTTPQLVQGRLTVSEPGTTYPNPAADAARKDQSAWLDTLGQVQIFGVDQVPQGLVPQWKTKGWGVRWVIPVWVWLAGAGGVLLLGVFILLAWILCVKRRRQRPQPDTYVEEAEQRPANQAWATRGHRSNSPKPQHHNGWWEEGQVSTPPGSRGATEDRRLRSSRTLRSSKQQQRIREEGRLHRHHVWDEEPPELPGAYR